MSRSVCLFSNHSQNIVSGLSLPFPTPLPLQRLFTQTTNDPCQTGLPHTALTYWTLHTALYIYASSILSPIPRLLSGPCCGLNAASVRRAFVLTRPAICTLVSAAVLHVYYLRRAFEPLARPTSNCLRRTVDGGRTDFLDDGLRTVVDTLDCSRHRRKTLDLLLEAQYLRAPLVEHRAVRASPRLSGAILHPSFFDTRRVSVIVSPSSSLHHRACRRTTTSLWFRASREPTHRRPGLRAFPPRTTRSWLDLWVDNPSLLQERESPDS